MNRSVPSPFSPPPPPSIGWQPLAIVLSLVAMEVTALVGLLLR